MVMTKSDRQYIRHNLSVDNFCVRIWLLAPIKLRTTFWGHGKKIWFIY